MTTDLAAFLIAKSAAGLSRLTLDWYQMFVSQYLAWSEALKMPIQKPETVEGYLHSLRERGLKPSTVSGCYRALSVYFNWMVQRGKLPVSPVDRVQAPRLPKPRKRHVSAADFNRLYRSIAGDKWTDQRDRAILLVLFYSGLRANELLALRLSDVDEEEGLLKVVNGKGGEDRDVPFAPQVGRQIADYLRLRPAYNGRRLFVAGGGHPHVVRGPLTYSGLTQMVRRRCQAAAVPRINVHAFRHGYAMLFLNEGEMELGAVSATMGHSSVDLTRRFYADYATSSLRQRYNAALGRIDMIRTD